MPCRGRRRTGGQRRERGRECPTVPFIALVGSPRDWSDFQTGTVRRGSDCDLVARLSGMRRVHKAYAGTAAICTGGAGTSARASDRARSSRSLRPAATHPGSAASDRLGLHLAKRLRAHGLHDVAGEIWAPLADRDGFGEFLALSAERVGGLLVNSGRLTQEELTRGQEMLEDPAAWVMPPLYVYAWGHTLLSQ